eukprot:GDKI01014527.1.p1 GENE.GDKI01014527.1~~GDKI01014527.1.p1  ORF type:complete len:225 (+),score=60.66 GDKI01014527.1:1-675(+)
MSVVPIYESTPLAHQVFRTDLGGRDITEYLQGELGTARPFTKCEHQEAVRGIKEALCYVAEDPEAEAAKEESEVSMSHTLEYATSWGNEVTLAHERWRASEVLFNPLAIIGRDVMSATTLLSRAINESPIDVRKALTSNILLSGGSCEMLGFDKRIETELQKVLPSQPRVLPVECARDLLSWRGACLAAVDLREHQGDLWVSRAEWDEYGSTILERKNPLAQDR